MKRRVDRRQIETLLDRLRQQHLLTFSIIGAKADDLDFVPFHGFSTFSRADRRIAPGSYATGDRTSGGMRGQKSGHDGLQSVNVVLVVWLDVLDDLDIWVFRQYRQNSFGLEVDLVVVGLGDRDDIASVVGRSFMSCCGS